MNDLSTNFLGLKLNNPLLAGACGLTANLDSIKRLEEAGVGAVVLKSLFEEEIELEAFRHDEELAQHDNLHPEMISVLPRLPHGGPAEHLEWVARVKREVSIPVIASLNAVRRETWLEWARKLADTGVDALECNLFAMPGEPQRTGADIESEQVELVRELGAAIDIPLAVKLSPFYTNPQNVIRRMDEAGASGFVLFNKAFDPDIDPDSEEIISPWNVSEEKDARLPIRWIGFLGGTVDADLCGSSGVYTGEQVAAMVLVGADAVQVVSSLYRGGIDHVRAILDDLESWMERKGYSSLGELRGKLSKSRLSDPMVYTRVQYAKTLIDYPELETRVRAG